MKMKYRQTIVENIGIEIDEFVPGYSHNDGISFRNGEQEPVHQMMEVMVLFLIDQYRRVHYNAGVTNNLKYILDVGSGPGGLAYFFRKYDPNLIVFTLDGNQETINSPYIDKDTHFVVRTDQEYKLVDENENIIKFDLIVCIEHIEHIQESNFRQFLKNLGAHAHKDTLFFGTAANWEYESDDEKQIHCNVKSADEWRGYLYQNRELFKAAATITLSEWAMKFIDHSQSFSQETTSLATVFDTFEAPLIVKCLIGYFLITEKHPKTHDEHRQHAALESWTHRFAGSTIILLGF